MYYKSDIMKDCIFKNNNATSQDQGVVAFFVPLYQFGSFSEVQPKSFKKMFKIFFFIYNTCYKPILVALCA
jgi:hypothetical protein